jgi:hypothetical protein
VLKIGAVVYSGIRLDMGEAHLRHVRISEEPDGDTVRWGEEA